MNKLREKIESVGLNFKTTILFAALIALAGIGIGFALFFILKNIICMAFCIVSAGLVDYIFLTRYKGIAIQQEENLNYEFIGLLSFFKIYISNGYSVYQSFKELIPFASLKLQERLCEFVNDIDQDKTINPFIKFAKKFNSPKLEQLLIDIFQIVDDGNNLMHLSQFEMIFSKLRDETYKTNLSKKEKSLSSLNTFPLIGSGLLIVMITFGIIEVIGGMVNGI